MQHQSPYKTAAELGIQQWEHDGLVALVGPLSRGELDINMSYPTAPWWYYEDLFKSEPRPNAICGTCHCIGGWLAFQHGIKTSDEIGDYVHRHDSDDMPMHSLFFPSNHIMETATAPQASRAIINFLTLGNPRWDKVMV